jgi:hypothetical protein
MRPSINDDQYITHEVRSSRGRIGSPFSSPQANGADKPGMRDDLLDW